MDKAKKISTLIILIIIGCLLVIVINTNLKNTKDSNEIVMKDLDGNVQTISFSEKPSVLLFFTSWCPYCNDDAPKIVSLYQKYKNEINIYGINLIHRENDPDDVKEYVSDYNIEYPVLFDDGGKLYRKYGSPGFPTLVFLDKNGKEVNRIVGSTAKKVIERQFINAMK
ncbi:TlpA family protein disulfide reductase [Paenibacillus hamazuiensis]|uniref:TlpA family protein disulfide reductase n=1 Tax=Paenibacillus hamazuiensis TaxID=2936508 RepID=UPI002010708E|nr:TlpA disulfide reductase family protein [Paenibacillus hamazuiensis]